MTPSLMILYFIGVLALAFVGGFLVGERRAPPYKTLTKRDAFFLGWKPTHLHQKTRNYYEEMTRAIAADAVEEGDAVVVYVDNEGRIWVRTTEGFDAPGRFTELGAG